MKKIIVFALISALALSLCACKKGEPSGSSEYSEIESSSSQSELSSELSSVASQESSLTESSVDEHTFMPEIPSDNKAFLEKFNANSLDIAYEEELETAFSAKQWVEISKKYADFWLAEIDNAYKCLLVEADNTSAIKDDQANWLSSCEEKIRKIESEVQADSGSLSRFNAANEIMLLYRGRAAELYEKLYAYDPDFSFSFVANG